MNKGLSYYSDPIITQCHGKAERINLIAAICWECIRNKNMDVYYPARKLASQK